jgi:hypothetical protein
MMKTTFLKSRNSWVYAAMVLAILLLPSIAGAQEANEYVGAKLTSGRTVSLLLLVMSIASVVIAFRSRKLSDNKNRNGSVILAGVLGLVAVIFSVIRITASTGFGTGGGKAGAIFALLMGIVGIGLALKTFLQARNSNPN